MKYTTFSKLAFSICFAIAIAGPSAHAQSSGGAGGGSPEELDYKALRTSILNWVKINLSKSEVMSTLHLESKLLTPDSLYQKLLSVQDIPTRFISYKLTDDGKIPDTIAALDRVEIIVDGKSIPRTCVNHADRNPGEIICNTEAYDKETETSRERLVFHEDLGYLQIETNHGVYSDYPISSNLPAFESFASDSDSVPDNLKIAGRGIQNKADGSIILLACVGLNNDCSTLRLLQFKPKTTPIWLGHPFPVENEAQIRGKLSKWYSERKVDSLFDFLSGNTTLAFTSTDGWNWSNSPLELRRTKFRRVTDAAVTFAEFYHSSALAKKLESVTPTPSTPLVAESTSAPTVKKKAGKIKNGKLGACKILYPLEKDPAGYSCSSGYYGITYNTFFTSNICYASLDGAMTAMENTASCEEDDHIGACKILYSKQKASNGACLDVKQFSVAYNGFLTSSSGVCFDTVDDAMKNMKDLSACREKDSFGSCKILYPNAVDRANIKLNWDQYGVTYNGFLISSTRYDGIQDAINAMKNTSSCKH